MSYPINYPTPQGANVQIFQAPFAAASSTQAVNNPLEWIKPQGASFVWFTLIGPGAAGTTGGTGNSTGGGSGAVTNFMCPAFLIPDVLTIAVGRGSILGTQNTTVIYYKTSTTLYTLLSANGGITSSAGGSGGAAMTANYFTAIGFFQSIAGQAGQTADADSPASSTTFLSGGAGGGSTNNSAGGKANPNYGYDFVAGGFGANGNGKNGYFLTQPIIVGAGGGGGGGSSGSPGGNGGNAGVGCGGGGGGLGTVNGNGGNGGNGLVVIITW